MKPNVRILFVLGAALTPTSPAAAQLLAFQRVAFAGGGVIRERAGDLDISVTLGQPIIGTAGAGGIEMTFGFWAMELAAAPPAVRIVSWTSARTHAGVLRGIELDPVDGRAVSESRQVDAGRERSGIRLLVVRFDAPVRPSDGRLEPEDVLVQDHHGQRFLADAVALQDDDRELAVSFSAGTLPNARRYTVEVGGRFEGRAGGALQGDTGCDVRALVGDVDSSGVVDVSDVVAVGERVGQTVTDETGRLDIDTSGRITWLDVFLVALRLRMSAP